MKKKETVGVPDTYEFRSALIFHNLDSDLRAAELRMLGEVRGLNMTEAGDALRKIRELRRDLSKQFAKVWQREHGGPDPA